MHGHSRAQQRGEAHLRAGSRLHGGAAFVIFVLAEVALYSTRTSEALADAAVVLGAAVYTDRPSPVFEERIRHAVDLYKAGRVRLLVMTGGLGPGDTLTEAEAARQWSLEQGVPS